MKYIMSVRERNHKVVNIYGSEVAAWERARAVAADEMDGEDPTYGEALEYICMAFLAVRAEPPTPVEDALDLAAEDIDAEDPTMMDLIETVSRAYVGAPLNGHT